MRCSDSEDASDGSSGHDSMALPLLCVQVYMDDYIVHNVWRILRCVDEAMRRCCLRSWISGMIPRLVVRLCNGIVRALMAKLIMWAAGTSKHRD